MAGVDPQMCGRHEEAIKRLDGWQASQNGNIRELRGDFTTFTGAYAEDRLEVRRDLATFTAAYAEDRLATLRASRNTLIAVVLNLLGVIVTLGLVVLKGG